MSENTAELPFCETANTWPRAVLKVENGLVEALPKFATVINIAPKALPAYALSPAASSCKEFGGLGNVTGLPARLVEVEIL